MGQYKKKVVFDGLAPGSGVQETSGMPFIMMASSAQEESAVHCYYIRFQALISGPVGVSG